MSGREIGKTHLRTAHLVSSNAVAAAVTVLQQHVASNASLATGFAAGHQAARIHLGFVGEYSSNKAESGEIASRGHLQSAC